MDNSKKIILISIISVLIIAAVLLLTTNGKKSSPVVSSAATTTPISDGINPIKVQLPQQTLPLSSDPKEAAWAIFQKYLGYNKNDNLDGVKSIVYKISAICVSAATSTECKNRMDQAFGYGSALKKEDFVNVWSDSRQTILATDFKIQEDDTAIGRNRAIIFFVRDQSNNLKLLSFSPFKGAVLIKASSTRGELLSKLTAYTEDKDQDGIADYDEQCLGASAGQTCTKTDPTLRDTNGNGLWDGVEALMNQKI